MHAELYKCQAQYFSYNTDTFQGNVYTEQYGFPMFYIPTGQITTATKQRYEIESS